MADPLCRWRYASPKTVVEIVRALPKVELSESSFLSEVQNALSGGGFSFDFSTFQKTAYQLAVQLGLYYIDAAGKYHPRFNHDIDEDTAAKYLAVVARCYVAPNPYTNAVSFGQGQLPVNLFSAILEHASTLPDGTDFDVATALGGRFSAQLGNPDAITALMSSTSVFKKVGSKNLSYAPVLDTTVDREAFFNLIAWPACSSEQHSALKGEIISAALKLFQQKRYSDWLAQGSEVNARLREYFDPLTEQSLGAMTGDKIGELFLGVKDATGQHVDLVTMWAGRNGNGWSNIDPGGDAQKFQRIRDYLVRLKHDTAIASTFWAGNDPDRPPGFGSSVVTELLMKFHPDEVLMYAKEGCGTLKQLGLIEFDAPNADNGKRAAEFKLVQAAGTIILAKMRAMNIDKFIKSDGTGDGTAADYMTVNEFLCFVKEYQQDILNAVKEKQMAKIQKKPTTGKTTTGTATISALLENKEDSLMTRLVAALLTKPLVILAGASGTGKSRMVRHLAYKTCLDADLKPEGGSAPGNFKMIQVKPNWHDSADLLGYRSVVSETSRYVTTEFVKFVLKAHAYPNTPFFVCLDEMNLAPVEHYFAEFLSACESIRKDENGKWTSDPIVSATDFAGSIANLEGEVAFESDDAALDAQLKAVKAIIEKDGLFIPRNLFVVGTVNMDDTTGCFSRKVLDRAMTIEMNEVHFKDLQAEDKGLSMDAANLFTEAEIKKFIERPDFDGQTMLDDGFRDQMETLRGKLEKTPFALAYRFARETTLYRKALTDILDAAAVVKKGDGSPKTDGNGSDIDAKRACGEIALDHMVLMKLLPRLNGTVSQRETVLKDIDAFVGALIKDKKFSKETLDDMKKRAVDNGGYLSFWP